MFWQISQGPTISHITSWGIGRVAIKVDGGSLRIGQDPHRGWRFTEAQSVEDGGGNSCILGHAGVSDEMDGGAKWGSQNGKLFLNPSKYGLWYL